MIGGRRRGKRRPGERWARCGRAVGDGIGRRHDHPGRSGGRGDSLRRRRWRYSGGEPGARQRRRTRSSERRQQRAQLRFPWQRDRRRRRHGKRRPGERWARCGRAVGDGIGRRHDHPERSGAARRQLPLATGGDTPEAMDPAPGDAENISLARRVRTCGSGSDGKALAAASKAVATSPSGCRSLRRRQPADRPQS